MQYASFEADHVSVGQPSQAGSGYPYPLYGGTEQSTNRYIPMQTTPVTAPSQPVPQVDAVPNVQAADPSGSEYAEHIPYAEALLKHAQLIHQSCGHLEQQLNSNGLYTQQMHPVQRPAFSGGRVSNDPYIQTHCEIEHLIQQLKSQQQRPSMPFGQAGHTKSRFDKLCEDLVNSQRLKWIMQLERFHCAQPRNHLEEVDESDLEYRVLKRARVSEAEADITKHNDTNVELKKIAYKKRLEELNNEAEQGLSDLQDLVDDQNNNHNAVLDGLVQPGERLLAEISTNAIAWNSHHVQWQHLIERINSTTEQLQHHKKPALWDVASEVANMQGGQSEIDRFYDRRVDEEITEFCEKARTKLASLKEVFASIDQSESYFIEHVKSRNFSDSSMKAATASGSEFANEWITFAQYQQQQVKEKEKRRFEMLMEVFAIEEKLTTQQRKKKLMQLLASNASLLITDKSGEYKIADDWVLQIAKKYNSNYLNSLLTLVLSEKHELQEEKSGKSTYGATTNLSSVYRNFLLFSHTTGFGENDSDKHNNKLHSTVYGKIENFWSGLNQFCTECVWTKQKDFEQFISDLDTQNVKTRENDPDIFDYLCALDHYLQGDDAYFKGSGKHFTKMYEASYDTDEKFEKVLKGFKEALNNAVKDHLWWRNPQYTNFLQQWMKEEEFFAKVQHKLSEVEEKLVREDQEYKTPYYNEFIYKEFQAMSDAGISKYLIPPCATPQVKGICFLDCLFSKEEGQAEKFAYQCLEMCNMQNETNKTRIIAKEMLEFLVSQSNAVPYLFSLVVGKSQSKDAFKNLKKQHKQIQKSLQQSYEKLVSPVLPSKPSRGGIFDAKSWEEDVSKPAKKEKQKTSTDIANLFDFEVFASTAIQKLDILIAFTKKQAKTQAQIDALPVDPEKCNMDMLRSWMYEAGFIPDITDGYTSHVNEKDDWYFELHVWARKAYWVLALIAELQHMGVQLDGFYGEDNTIFDPYEWEIATEMLLEKRHIGYKKQKLQNQTRAALMQFSLYASFKQNNNNNISKYNKELKLLVQSMKSNGIEATQIIMHLKAMLKESKAESKAPDAKKEPVAKAEAESKAANTEAEAEAEAEAGVKAEPEAESKAEDTTTSNDNVLSLAFYAQGFVMLCAMTIHLMPRAHIEKAGDDFKHELLNVCLLTMINKGNQIKALVNNYIPNEGLLYTLMTDKDLSSRKQNEVFGVHEHIRGKIRQWNLIDWANTTLTNMSKVKYLPTQINEITTSILYEKLHPLPLAFEDAVLPLFDANGLVRSKIEQMYICTLAQQVLTDLLSKHPHLRHPEMSLELMYQKERNDFFNEFVQLINMQEQLTKRFSGTRVTYARDAQHVAKHYHVMCFVFKNARITSMTHVGKYGIETSYPYLLDSRASKSRFKSAQGNSALSCNTCEILVRSELVRSLDYATEEVRRDKMIQDALAKQRLERKHELEAELEEQNLQLKKLEIQKIKSDMQYKQEELELAKRKAELNEREAQHAIQSKTNDEERHQAELELKRQIETNRTEIANREQAHKEEMDKAKLNLELKTQAHRREQDVKKHEFDVLLSKTKNDQVTEQLEHAKIKTQMHKLELEKEQNKTISPSDIDNMRKQKQTIETMLEHVNVQIERLRVFYNNPSIEMTKEEHSKAKLLLDTMEFQRMEYSKDLQRLDDLLAKKSH